MPTEDPTLTERQWAVLRAAMDAIVPADDFPSASQAGVEEYFRRQLAGDLQALLPLYKDGLTALDEEARSAGIVGFAEASAAEQDALLKIIERGDVQTVWPESPAVFFQRLVNQVMEGYYADPGNGGNRGEVSWKMVGFGGRKT